MATATVYFGDDVTEDVVAKKLTLSQARRRRLWSITRLSKESEVAVSTIFEIERSKVKPRLSTIDKLSRALKCEPTDIDWPNDPLGEGPDTG